MEIRKLLSKFKKDEKGVFGLNAVQQFFVIILGIALLAFVIVIIMGTLSGTTILDSATGTATDNNKYVNQTGYTLEQSTLEGFSGAITSVVNATDGVVIGSGNYTLSGKIISNATATTWSNVNITYSYTYNSDAQSSLDYITGNTSEGITGFFSSISPVYAILAVLVIILVLVVLVKVVQTPNGREGSTPQL